MFSVLIGKYFLNENLIILRKNLCFRENKIEIERKLRDSQRDRERRRERERERERERDSGKQK